MDNTLLAGIIQATATIIGVILAALLGVAIGRRQARRRKIIEYEIYSASLLPKAGLAQPLSLTVDASFLTGAPAPGVMVPAKTAYSHTISFTNVGEESVIEPLMEITLDEHAFIAKVETVPEDSPNYVVTQTRDFADHNRLTIKVPYINRKQSITVIIISIQGQSDQSFIKVIGPNIEVRELDRQSSNETANSLMRNFLIGVALTAFLAMLLNLLVENARRVFDENFVYYSFLLTGILAGILAISFSFLQSRSSK